MQLNGWSTKVESVALWGREELLLGVVSFEVTADGLRHG